MVPPGPTETVSALLHEVRGVLASPPFLGVAAESSQVDPVQALWPGLRPPSLPIDAAEKGVKAVEALGRLRGAALRAVGINVDFSLSLDLTPPDSRPAFAASTFGRDPEAVAACGQAYLRGLTRSNILACAGHFPGLGSAESAASSRTLLSAEPMARLWREDLAPFRRLLPQLPLTMISPAAYKAYDFDPPRPAIFSHNVVTGLLRMKLGYQGIAVASLPDLEVSNGKLDLGEAAVRSLEAGCDLLIVSGNNDSLDRVTKAISDALATARFSTPRLEASLSRIARAKKKLYSPDDAGVRRAVKAFAREYREWSDSFGG